MRGVEQQKNKMNISGPKQGNKTRGEGNRGSTAQWTNRFFLGNSEAKLDELRPGTLIFLKRLKNTHGTPMVHLRMHKFSLHFLTLKLLFIIICGLPSFYFVSYIDVVRGLMIWWHQPLAPSFTVVIIPVFSSSSPPHPPFSPLSPGSLSPISLLLLTKVWHCVCKCKCVYVCETSMK